MNLNEGETCLLIFGAVVGTMLVVGWAIHYLSIKGVDDHHRSTERYIAEQEYKAYQRGER